MDDQQSRCQLCQRSMSYLTRHHLIPRSYHHNKRIRRQHSLTDLQQTVLWLCPACHKQVHALLDEKQLAFEYNNLNALLQYAPLQRFVNWVAAKPNDFIPTTQRSHK